MIQRGRTYIAIVGVLTLPLAGALVVRAQAPRSPSPSSPQAVGRYQIVINPQARADTFMLDTETGRIWQLTKYTDLEGDPTIWELQDRANSLDELLAWGKLHKSKAK